MTYLASIRALACSLTLVLTVPIVPLNARAQDATPAMGVDVVVEGIANPRGFIWGEDGTMYLATGGSGGDNPGPEGTPFWGGDTASVAMIRDGTVTPLAEGLASFIWRDIDWVWGVADVAILDDQLYALVAGGGAIHGNPDSPSGIYRVHADGTTTLLADLGAWVDENPVASPPPEGVPNNGSFFAMVAVDDALWVCEAVNGQILQVTPTGEIRRIADLSGGHPVPSGLAADPNGGAYVGVLTAAPYSPGSAKVMRVAPDGTVDDVWTGLTAVTDVAVGPEGALYAAEMSAEISDADPFLTENTGRVVRQTGPDSMEAIAAGLDMPVSLGFGPDDALYVSTPALGSNTGSGQVVRIDLAASAPGAALNVATPLT